MQALREATHGAQDGVVTGSLGGKVWAGTLPEGVAFGDFAMGSEAYEMVAGRIGNKVMHLIPARINPDTREVTLPEFTWEQVEEVGPFEFVPALPEVYKHVPVV